MEDVNTKLFSATTPQFPEAFAEGRSKDEAIENLIALIPIVINDRKDSAADMLLKNPYVSSQKINVAVYS